MKNLDYRVENNIEKDKNGNIAVGASKTMRVKFLLEGAKEYLDLTPGNAYRVIEIIGDEIRILSDEGLPYVYPQSLFEVVDAQEPADWEITYEEYGRRYCAPTLLREDPEFFSKYFEGDPQTRGKLRKYLSKWRRGET